MFCSKCGNQIPEGTAFCAACGTPAAQRAPAQQPAYTPAPQQPAYAPVPQQPAAPRQAAPADRRKKGGLKRKTMVMITMCVSLLLILCSIISALNKPFYKIPALSLVLLASGERDEAIGELLAGLDQTIEQLDDELDYQEDFMDRDELEAAEQVVKSMKKLRDNCSITNFRSLVKLAEKINNEFDFGVDEDDFKEIHQIMGIVMAVIIGFFVLPVVFTLLGGLKRNLVLTIIGMVFTAISQMIFAGLLWVVLSLAVGIFQAKVCNDINKRRKARMAYGRAPA